MSKSARHNLTYFTLIFVATIYFPSLYFCSRFRALAQCFICFGSGFGFSFTRFFRLDRFSFLLSFSFYSPLYILIGVRYYTFSKVYTYVYIFCRLYAHPNFELPVDFTKYNFVTLFPVLRRVFENNFRVPAFYEFCRKYEHIELSYRRSYVLRLVLRKRRSLRESDFSWAESAKVLRQCSIQRRRPAK